MLNLAKARATSSMDATGSAQPGPGKNSGDLPSANINPLIDSMELTTRTAAP
jgi:hypothetical protein